MQFCKAAGFFERRVVLTKSVKVLWGILLAAFILAWPWKSYGSEADSVREFQEETVFENQGVYDFLNRLYVIILGRNPDAEGMRAWYEQWKAQLIQGSATGAQIVQGFIFSEECVNKNLSDEAYVDLLYRALFDHQADDEGKASWLDLLNREDPEFCVLRVY